MSEYWKSTPKHWCKYCKVFVKDTKLERQQHDATPRHQSAIQKSLRSLHREKEQEDREKQRAKNEIARLNGLAGGGSSGPSVAGGAIDGSKATFTKAKDEKRPATLEERKRQMQQLADMGIAVPEEYRKEMGMAGDWQTIQVRRVQEAPLDIKDEFEADSKEAKAVGIRKRKFEDQEEEEAILGTGDASSLAPRNRNWGSRMKAFPGKTEVGGDDLDALLGGVQVKKDIVKDEDDEEQVKAEAEESVPEIKKSESDEERDVVSKVSAVSADAPVKAEDTEVDVKPPVSPPPGTGIVFKKRKKIAR